MCVCVYRVENNSQPFAKWPHYFVNGGPNTCLSNWRFVHVLLIPYVELGVYVCVYACVVYVCDAETPFVR